MADDFQAGENLVEDSLLETVDLLAAIEAILMVAAQAVTIRDLVESMQMPIDQVEDALLKLKADYDGALGGRQRGFELRETQGGWKLFSRPKWAPWVGRFVVSSDTASLSQPALETLAIIAYRQPVTRHQIARVRGVNVDSVLRTLAARGLIEESGHGESGAHLFRTTVHFLERMGLTSLDDLPPLAPFMPDADSVESLAAQLK